MTSIPPPADASSRPGRACKVLLVEDSPWDAKMASEALAASLRPLFDVERVDRLSEARAALARERKDVVVLDLNLPDSSGLDTVVRLRQTAGPDVPVVVLTSTVRDSMAARALRAGADEFVPKDVLDASGRVMLARAIQYALEQRALRARFEALARQHETTLDAIPDIVVRLDQDGRVAWGNRAAEELLGPGRVVGRSALDFVALEDRPRAKDGIAEARFQASEAAVPTRILTTRGMRHYEWMGAPLFDERGFPVGNVGIGRDITAEVEATDHARALAAERAELERMRVAEKERTRFFGIVAHELNNPLSSLMLQVAVLRERATGGLNEKQARVVSSVDATLRRLRDLTRDLLDTARIQSGELRLRVEDVDLAALALATITDYAVVASEARLSLDARAPAPLPVSGDPRRLAGVLVNYLSNAVKFTPSGGRVCVECVREGSHAVLRVRDSGAGLDAGQRARLFQPFVRVHEQASAKGTGLGLYICKSIVASHGGTVGCESDGPGKGATFWLRLPLREA